MLMSKLLGERLKEKPADAVTSKLAVATTVEGTIEEVHTPDAHT